MSNTLENVLMYRPGPFFTFGYTYDQDDTTQVCTEAHRASVLVRRRDRLMDAIIEDRELEYLDSLKPVEPGVFNFGRVDLILGYVSPTKSAIEQEQNARRLGLSSLGHSRFYRTTLTDKWDPKILRDSLIAAALVMGGEVVESFDVLASR